MVVVTGMVAIGALSCAAPALAVNPVIANCNANSGNSLSRPFTVTQLQAALNSMTSEERQYYSCAQVITAAILRAKGRLHLGGGGGGGGSGVPVVLVVLIVVVVGAGGGYGVRVYRRR